MEDKEASTNTAVVLRMPRPKKKRASVNPLRVALFMVRRHSSGGKDPLHAEVVKPGGRGLWKTLLAAMRPLLHNHHHPPHQLEHTNSAPALPVTAATGDPREAFHDVHAPPSPSSDGTSRYGSADDLQALDADGSDGEAEGGGGPHAIDVRAEEFIARFYEQMRLQRLESVNRRRIEEGAC